MKTNTLLTAAWIALGAYFVITAIVDLSQWRSDPALVRMGVDWMDSRLPEGVVALLCGVGLLVGRRPGQSIALITSVLFGVYFLAYMVLGGEGTIFLRMVVPVTMLCLVGATLVHVRRLRREGARASPPS
jgi:hypothetical protein